MGLTRAEAEALGLGHLFPPPPTRTGRSAHTRGVMNRTEANFAATYMEPRRLDPADPLIAWSFELDTLILSPDARYTPDFRLELDGFTGYEFIDVKGNHTWEDSIVKGKFAAALFPYHRFYLARLAPACLKQGKFLPARWQLRRLGARQSVR